jgi:hypothetical protein
VAEAELAFEQQVLVGLTPVEEMDFVRQHNKQQIVIEQK